MSGKLELTILESVPSARRDASAWLLENLPALSAVQAALLRARYIETGFPALVFLLLCGVPVLELNADEPAGGGAPLRELAFNGVSVARVESSRGNAGGDGKSSWIDAAAAFRLLPPSGSESDAQSGIEEAPIPVATQSVAKPNTSRASRIARSVIPVPAHSTDFELPEREATTRDLTGPCPWRIGSRFKGLTEERTEEDRCGFFHRDLMGPEAVKPPPRQAAFERLLRRIGARQLRNHFRGDLRDDFKADPSFGYQEYLRRREEIARMGREELSSQDIEAEAHIESSRNGVLRKDSTIEERDIPVVDWGPLRISDRGSVTLGFSRLANKRQSPHGVELAPEEKAPVGQSLFQKETYSIDTDLKWHPDPEAMFGTSNYREALGKLTATVEFDFLTPILQRRYMTTELELSVDEEDRSSFFINFVIYGSK